MKPTAQKMILAAAKANGWTVVDMKHDARMAVPMYVEYRKGIARVAVHFTRAGGVQRGALMDGNGVIVVPTRLKAQAVLDELAG